MSEGQGLPKRLRDAESGPIQPEEGQHQRGDLVSKISMYVRYVMWDTSAFIEFSLYCC
jgi:hypothetical protein